MAKQQIYITTAIPYANGLPHIGHVMDYLLADVWARYQRQIGRQVRFQAGVDEHGNKIAAKAADAGLEPQAYVDQTHLGFKNLLSDLNISQTDFVRTTDQHHQLTVQYIWQRLVESGYIYKHSYTGWYCQGCEAFVTDKEAANNNGLCPDHQTPYQRLSEENYYFKASAMAEKIRQAIDNGKMKIIPESRKNEFLELIKDGLSDVSVSRPRKNLSWGISVPSDESQVIYVWLDALSSYISVIGYPDRVEEWSQAWPADVQAIGKDILRFHAGIWPAMLIALGLSLPKVLLVHGFINVQGTKMSKSLGNGIEPKEIITNYGVDAFRYYFLRHIPTQDDGNFTWEKFEAAYNGELGNDLGNLVQRVAKMVQTYQAGVIGDARQAEYDTRPYRLALEKFEFSQALDEVWQLIRSLNQYIERVQPWQIAKRRDQDPEAIAHLSEVLAHACGSLLQIAGMLEPFLPETAQKIKALFASGVVPQDLAPLFPRKLLHSAAPEQTATL